MASESCEIPCVMAEIASDADLSGLDIARIQRRTVGVLSAGQILGGLGFGATVSVGAILAADMTGDDSLSGLATAGVTLGTALLAIPMAAFARTQGRRLSLTLGTMIALAGVCLVIVSATISAFPLLLLAFAMIGGGQAANLQSRFAATDLAVEATRGRDLSIVVWTTTIGAVLGPNLVGPGEWLGQIIGMPPLTGPFLFTVVAQVLAVTVYLVLLRPDPLLLAHRLVSRDSAGQAAATATRPDHPRVARFAILAIAGAHVVMVSVMAMTPVHLVNHGAALSIVGLTISLHVLGMFGLSPLFGILADKVGRVRTILLGQIILAVSLVMAAVGQESTVVVTCALVLIGVGWSATSVGGSTLLVEASGESQRTRRQGLSDFTMSMVGAGGAAAAGAVLGAFGYGGLALLSGIAVVLVIACAPLGRLRQPTQT